MHLASPQSVILFGDDLQCADHHWADSLALKGVAYRAIGAGALLRRNLMIYGLGGIIIPFIGIKAIDLVVAALHLALTSSLRAQRSNPCYKGKIGLLRRFAPVHIRFRLPRRQ